MRTWLFRGYFKFTTTADCMVCILLISDGCSEESNLWLVQYLQYTKINNTATFYLSGVDPKDIF